MHYDIAIVGGGISGLSALHYCRKFHPSKKIVLLEKSSQCGGNIQTTFRDGFLWENGPRSFLAKEPAMAELIEDLGLSSNLVEANAKSKKRYIIKNAKLEAVPMGPMQMFRSPLSNWAVLKELKKEWSLRSVSAKGETVAEFARRRWGAEIATTFIGPMVSGVFAGDAEKLEVEAAFPRLLALEKEKGSVLKGALFGKKRKGPFEGVRSSRLLSFKNGMEELPQSLIKVYGENIKTDKSVSSINREGEDWVLATENAGVIEKVTAKSLLLSCPMDVISSLFDDTPELPSEVLAYPPLLVLHLGFEKIVHDYEGFGYLAPVPEGLSALGVLLNDHIFPGLAHVGSSMTIMAGGMRFAEMSKNEIAEWVEKLIFEQKKLLGIEADVLVKEVCFYERSIPQYNRGTCAYWEKLQNWAQVSGVSLCGNYLHGVGINDCVRNAKEWALSL
ncbi:MAG: protoporphyrinogen oxidase [Planctomycetes bacterium]|nr:protoporphyrinogen oxidase [Planctomycetota bacterium]